jgi:GNAT superfamily N-acetyltransferase
MGVKVRYGTKNDIAALVEVECSDVKTWYRYSSKGRGSPALYDELSPWERYMHGGPWMDASTLTRYWVRIERLGIIPLVAEIDGKVVGHLDVIFSSEPRLGDFLYLDVLTVHKAYRRRGVARALITKAEKLARRKDVPFMMVQPEEYDGPSGLTYRSCGFERAFEAYHLETTIEASETPGDICVTAIPQAQRAPLKTHAMICGWYNISVKTWDYGLNPNVDLLRAFSCHQLALSALTGEGTYFFHLKRSYFDHEKGTICLWAPLPLDIKRLERVFQVARTSGSWIGIKRLSTESFGKNVEVLKNVGFSIKSEDEPYLIKWLKPKRRFKYHEAIAV